MPLIPAKVIARIRATSSSDLGQLTWEWVLRADGQVSYRLTVIGRRQERNPWQPVTRLPTAQLQAARSDHTRSLALLAGRARHHGHQTGLPRLSSY